MGDQTIDRLENHNCNVQRDPDGESDIHFRGRAMVMWQPVLIMDVRGAFVLRD